MEISFLNFSLFHGLFFFFHTLIVIHHSFIHCPRLHLGLQLHGCLENAENDFFFFFPNGSFSLEFSIIYDEQTEIQLSFL